nr:hypothetical protein [Tanacetum cinerariifolium]
MPFGIVEGYDVRHASFGIVHGGPRVQQFEMVPSASCPLDCIRYLTGHYIIWSKTSLLLGDQ